MDRKFKTIYKAKRLDASKYAAAASLKGALRAAVIRIVLREYEEAEIYLDGELVAWIYKNGRRETGVRIFKQELL